MLWRNIAKVAVAVAVGLGLASLGSAARAQTAPPPPPVFTFVDENGVDLASGKFQFSQTQATVGPVGEGGLAHVDQGSWLRTNMFGGIDGTDGHFTVSIGGSSAKFKLETSGAYTAEAGSLGQTLTLSGGVYTHTSSDGTVATFTAMSQVFPVHANAGLITSLVRPNGETLTWWYSDFAPDCSSPCKRLDAVTSNLGYMLKYEYGAGAYPTNVNLVKVTAINMGYDYCNPSASSCTPSNTSSSVTYATVSQNYPYTETSATDSLGRTTTYTTTYPFGGYMLLEASVITKIVNPAGISTDIAYNFQNRVASVTTPAGTWTYTYVELGGGALQTTVTDPLSHTRSVTTNINGQVISSTDGAGQTTTLTTDINTGLITRVTKPEGDSVDYTYDTRGNVTSATRNPKPGSGLPVYVTTAAYLPTCPTAKTCNKPTSVTEGGATTTFTYDTNHGGVLTVTGPAGANGVQPQVRQTYGLYRAVYLDASLTLVQSPTQLYLPVTLTTCAVAASPAPGCANTAEETKVTNYYGSSGANNLRVGHVTFYQGSTILSRTLFNYTTQGDISYVDGPLGGGIVDKAAFRYDSQRQVIGEIGVDPDGWGVGRRAVARKYQYMADGRVDWVENGTVASQSDTGWAGFTADERVDFGYDGAGRKIADALVVGEATQALTQYTYDGASRLECVAVRMTPAAFGSAPASACTLGTEGANGPDRIAKYEYDNADRQTLAISGYGTSSQQVDIATTYTANGQVQTVSDGQGNLTTYEYDAFDRLSKTRFPLATNGLVSSTTDYTELTYDNTTWRVSQELRRGGQVVSYTYDARGNVLSVSGPVASYTYDNFDRVQTATEGGQTLTTAYDSQGQVTSVTGPLGTVSYQYNAAGQRTRMTWPDGFYVTYDLDWTGAVTGIKENGITTLASIGYDNRGRRTSLNRGSGAAVTTYTYDPVSRLATLTQDLSGTDKDQVLAFGYNTANQITSRASNNTAYAWNGLYNVNRAYQVNGLNQTTASGPQTISYDSRGNLASDGVTTYGYDLDNRLTGTGAGAALAYDPADRLYQTTSSGGTVTKFAYDGADLIAEYTAAGAIQRRYIHGPGLDEPILWYEGSGTSDKRWMAADNQGSIIAVTNSSGVVTSIDSYDEYGIPAAGNQGRFQYTGQAWIPELGLYHYKARAYSPTLGRFLQSDPIGYGAGLNMYAYVGADPVNLGDSSGLLPGDPRQLPFTDLPGVEVVGQRPLNIALLDQVALNNQQNLRQPSSFNGGTPVEEVVVTGKRKKKVKDCQNAFPLTKNGLHVHVEELKNDLLDRLRSEGIDARLGETFRDRAMQDARYAQGRTTPGPIISNSPGGRSFHNFGAGFDILIYSANGAYIRDGQHASYTRAGQIGEAIGLTWGGRWKKPFDPGHFQFSNGNSTARMQALSNAGKDVLC